MKMQAQWALLSLALLVAVAAWASITTDYDHSELRQLQKLFLGQAVNGEFHLG